MSPIIQKIQIRNFRSIKQLSMSPGQMAILVGKNDTGKSNVLRALDLFFNGKETLSEREFKTNFNENAKTEKKKAKNIQIKLEIPLPKSYTKNNGDYIVWTKSWRSGSAVVEEKVGKRKSNIFQKNIEIKGTSNVDTFLKSIKYKYVPAIKDTQYFSQLQGDIYESISSDAGDETFRRSSTQFQKAISNQVKPLLEQIDKLLGIQSVLTLPNDLSHIFRSLDFLGKKSKISLDYRGDGIKARHIPIILKFISDRIIESKSRGPYPKFIWGYEEPENSLEMSNCSKLAEQLYGYLGNGVSQMFLTTHSPLIYDMHSSKSHEDKNVSRHNLYNDDKEGTIDIGETEDLDERMGVTAFISPRVTQCVAEYVNEIQKLESSLAAAAENNLFGKPTIFVEGKTDKRIYERAVRVFAPNYSDLICISTDESSGGVGYVGHMIDIWRRVSKHSNNTNLAAGIIDCDVTGKNNKGPTNPMLNNSNIKWAKVFNFRRTKIHSRAYVTYK